MEEYRAVRRITSGRQAIDGAGVHLTRVIGSGDTADYDPFLMLDAFDSRNPRDYIKGFPWHPHRGIETITYLISGEMEHQDSLGNRGVIHGGEAQWMTAGSGIIHQEMPAASRHMLGAQIWLNLPRSDKMCDPSYGPIAAEQIQEIEDGDAHIRLIAGSWNGHEGGFQGRHIPADYLDAEIAPGGEWTYVSDPEKTVFAYLVEGSADFSEHASGPQIEQKNAVLFTSGEKLHVQAGRKGARFLLLSARPLHEPIAWGGPIVMNTQRELQHAFDELDRDTFLKAGTRQEER